MATVGLVVGCRDGGALETTLETDSTTESPDESTSEPTTATSTGGPTSEPSTGEPATTTGAPMPACGDATVDAGEDCDDGNQVDGDECTNACRTAVCGDGVVQTGVEACDDGNADNTDLCVGKCVAAACGDGFVLAGTEECDDGNQADNDTCSNTCKTMVPCAGWAWNDGCWYTAPAVNQNCTTVCATHGGFNAATSTHTGNQVGMHFWPGKANGSNWMSVECSSTDNNTNWGANGQPPDPNFSHPACYVNCACNN